MDRKSPPGIASRVPSPRARRRASLVLSIAVAAAGCGEAVAPAGKLRPVKGKVTFSKPAALSGLKVRFLPNSPSARTALGEIQPDGSFAVTTGDQGEGIAEGEYRVRLERPANAKGKPAPSPIASQYFDEDGEHLTASIKADTTELPPFDLKPLSAPGAKRR